MASRLPIEIYGFIFWLTAQLSFFEERLRKVLIHIFYNLCLCSTTPQIDLKFKVRIDYVPYRPAGISSFHSKKQAPIFPSSSSLGPVSPPTPFRRHRRGARRVGPRIAPPPLTLDRYGPYRLWAILLHYIPLPVCLPPRPHSPIGVGMSVTSAPALRVVHTEPCRAPVIGARRRLKQWYFPASQSRHQSQYIRNCCSHNQPPFPGLPDVNPVFFETFLSLPVPQSPWTVLFSQPPKTISFSCAKHTKATFRITENDRMLDHSGFFSVSECLVICPHLFVHSANTKELLGCWDNFTVLRSCHLFGLLSKWVSLGFLQPRFPKNWLAGF